MVYPIAINSMEDVVRLNKVANKEDFVMSVSSGLDVVNAKSLLALFTMIGRKCNLVAPDGTNPENFAKAIKKMGFATV